MLRKGSLSFYNWCMQNNHQEYLNLWDYEQNEIDPNNISYSTSNKYYFKCSDQIHESYLYSIRSITVEGSHGPQCPVCNSIYQWCLNHNRQDIIDAWDDDKNNIDMKHVSRGSGKKAWFTFEHYSYYYTICNIIKNGSKHTDPVSKYKNSFGYFLLLTYGENGIKLFWSDKNHKSPFEYDKSSSSKVWIKCVEKDYHDDYQMPCYTFSGSNCRCPMCASKIIHPLDSFA